LLVDEPSDPDKVPTLIRRPAWVRPVKAVFDMIGIMPGYDEIDVSSAFLVFFSIFYGMLVGDAGYGLIFAILTVAARMKFKNMPKPVFSLLMITSFCTIGWGVLTGTYFGIAELPAPLRQVKIDWLSKDENIMALCFLIGAIHLTLAHGWKALAIGKRLLALAEIGWILVTWGMFFVARLMVLGRDMPAFAAPVLGVGVAAIVLFMTPVPKLKNEWFNHVMLPLDIISDFVDVVSYVRLFAVGMATLAVASAFNDMAIGDGINSIVGGLGAAVVLFIGHTLNIVMAIMGVLVHGLRLNALEFSQHMGITWKGFPYQPFARREREPAAEEVSG
jgi:V/A-type H+-transporting ATPase subunit I